ncbi:SRPBCC family protein [Antrihabitans sp. YC2-6]|uniref:SRPBCC family protein n=1 Tax=Antrihabitans sp. YC2-6 TaxID=2799498 RepID=UPI0018F34242|nr:SRPBCC family protein [Antrihabitans sp. YC2-6]MBJ8344725.1 SRPBCC family protein [Antrihabitans sp. YC2-6]
MTEPSATGTIEVAAPAAAVYAVVSDPAQLVTVAEETTKIVHRRARVGQVGARFMGINRRGWRLWPTLSKVTDADPGRRFAFEVGEFGIPVSRWQYDIESTATGCKVTESTWDRRPNWFKPVTVPFTGVRDRPIVNAQNIAKTLARLKDHVEGS